jgi:hypothetical protein
MACAVKGRGERVAKAEYANGQDFSQSGQTYIPPQVHVVIVQYPVDEIRTLKFGVIFQFFN